LTRNPDKAKDLVAQGAEVVKADMDDVASLTAALKGCYGVFGVQNFWELFGGVAKGDPIKARDMEVQQGKNLADAAKTAGIKHFVFSTLDEGSNCPHFQSKEEIEKYLKKIGVPSTFLLTSFYYENFGGFGMASWKDDTVVFSLGYPAEATMPMFSVGDTGGWTLAAFDDPEKWIGKIMPAVSQHISMKEIVAGFTKVTGVKAVYQGYDMEESRKGGPVAEEMYLNLKFFYNHQNGAPRDVKVSRELYPGALDWEGYLKASGWKGPQKKTA
jgi:uncharacterized protein YbjT (DUF2867 family)